MDRRDGGKSEKLTSEKQKQFSESEMLIYEQKKENRDHVSEQ